MAGTTQLVDLYDYMATLRRMKDYAPAVLYPGHGPCIGEPGDGGYAIEFLGRYEAHRQSREDQVVELLQRMLPDPDSDDEDDAATGGNLGGGLTDSDQWRYPTTTLIAQTLYQNTASNRMQNAKENIEKIMMKLCAQLNPLTPPVTAEPSTSVAHYRHPATATTPHTLPAGCP